VLDTVKLFAIILVSTERKGELIMATLIKASEVNLNIDMDFVNEKVERLNDLIGHGEVVFIVGRYSANPATREHLRGIFVKAGYRVVDSSNSHGVPTLRVSV